MLREEQVDNPHQVAAGLLTEADRQDLQKVIAARQEDIAQKQALLNRLKGQLSSSITTNVPGQETIKDASSILREALARAEEAREAAFAELKAKAAQEEVVAEKPPAEETKFAPIAAQVDEVYRLEKGVQVDVELPKPEPSPDTEVTSPRGDEKYVPKTIHAKEIRAEELVEKGEDVLSREVSLVAALPELTAEEKGAILKSSEFRAFIEKATKVFEKALNVDKIVDIYKDYTAVDHGKADAGSMMLGEAITYEDPRYSSKRPVHCVVGSKKDTNLFLASYGRRRDMVSSDSSEGVVLLWSVESPTRPEKNFTSPSPVTVACFDPSNPNIFYGGTVYGAILLWDAREGIRPIQKTKLSHHQCLIRHITFSGSDLSTSSVVTLDEESRCCIWNAGKALGYNNSTDFSFKSPTDSSLIKFLTTAATSKAGRIFGGTEDGAVYEATYNNSEATIAGYHAKRKDVADGNWHQAAITAVDVRPGNSASDELMLTSSLDWSIRIWSKVENNTYRPIHKLEPINDTIFSVKWNPSNSYLFASGSGTGLVQLWDLNHNWNIPVGTMNFNSGLTSNDWVLNGKRLCSGSSDGRIFSVSISQEQSKEYTDVAYFKANLEEFRNRSKPQAAGAY